jgi:hypothetical protein
VSLQWIRQRFTSVERHRRPALVSLGRRLALFIALLGSTTMWCKESVLMEKPSSDGAPFCVRAKLGRACATYPSITYSHDLLRGGHEVVLQKSPKDIFCLCKDLIFGKLFDLLQTKPTQMAFVDLFLELFASARLCKVD